MEDTGCTAEGGVNSVLKLIATPQTVANLQAQLLFFPLFQPDGNRILLQAKQMSGLEEIILISDGALIEQSFIGAVGDAEKGMIFVGPKHPVGKKVTQLIEEYHNRYNEDPFVSYFLSAFDAADILFTVIESVAIQKDNGTLEIDRKAFRDTLYQTTAYPGFTGVLNCDQFGDCGNAAFNILRLDIPEQGVVSLESNIIHGLKMNNIPGRTYKLS
jgi:branched-chain amino acid transport system substrate-binding protein